MLEATRPPGSRNAMLKASTKRTPRRKAGFSLIEIIVVVCVLSILITILLPGIQQMREAARRHECQNKLRQIGLAIWHYEGNCRVFPPGAVDTQGPVLNQPGVNAIGWTVQILPQLGHRALFRDFDCEAGAAAWKNRFDVPHDYTCPSNPYIADQVPGGGGHYAAVYHDVEAPIDVDNLGVMFLNSSIRPRDIDDGTANTLLVGETHGELLFPWGSGSAQTLRNTSLPFDTGPFTRNATVPVKPENPAFVGGFGSFHTGVVQFVFVDGSVKALSTEITPKIYRQLGHRADGGPVDGF
ncbi:MAG: DUF1559 domain-containing protein [Planctomycetota bacterium]|nr:DUF1559 domain-containing protein [Planctomycetota bacterium]